MSIFAFLADKASSELTCSSCKAPTFHGRNFYLPFCKKGLNATFGNICEATCDANEDKGIQQGSCDLCELKKCNQIFSPVCSLDGATLYANKCHAQCAGVEFQDCPGLNAVIPGKTPLPPNKELPTRLQNVEIAQEIDEDLKK